jgi:hypothetical protein
MSDAELAVLLVRRAYEAQFGAPLPVPLPAPRAPAASANSGSAPKPSANDGAAKGR